ncbi:MAG: AmmeMemoRadiSam system protein A, partial [Candidatus Parcubacteria bacterium]|nr:AmmeMemoRadiSam system protein A [Candidatus Parcubacteria bacterium]
MDPYVQLAKQTIFNHFGLKPESTQSLNLPKEMLTKKAGVFVTLYYQGKLRGCIGTLEPTKKNIAEEIKQNAIWSALEDSRFEPVTAKELNDLDISVDVLNPPIVIKDLKELDPKKYGVIVEAGRKKGLLLPDLEGVNTVAEQISIACEKAGIDENKENFIIYKFTV